MKRVASEVRCPTCRQLSAAESDAPAAEAVRVAIAARVEQGDSDAEIRAFLVDSYGKDILLTPGRSGVAALVWALPVAAFVCTLAGLAWPSGGGAAPGAARPPTIVRWSGALDAGPQRGERGGASG